MTRKNNAGRQEAIERLSQLLKPGDTVWTAVKHVSRSGMQRTIACYLFVDNEPRWISRTVQRATDNGWDDKRDGVKIGGCGMDMGFELIYQLSSTIWTDGFFCIGDGCPSNDHTNGDRSYVPHPHRDGGYCLRQRWL